MDSQTFAPVHPITAPRLSEHVPSYIADFSKPIPDFLAFWVSTYTCPSFCCAWGFEQPVIERDRSSGSVPICLRA